MLECQPVRCVLVLLIFLVGADHADAQQPLRWVLVGVQPLNISVKAQRLQLTVHVHNPQAERRILGPLRYRLHVAGGELLGGRLGDFIEVPAGQTREVRLRLRVSLDTLGRLLSARRDGEAYRFEGGGEFADRKSSFRFEDVGVVNDLQMSALRPLEPAL